MKEVTHCYHCALPVPEGTDHQVEILGESRPMCCKGCEAVACAIVAGGLEDFYRFRTENPPQGEELVPDSIRRMKLYDNPQIQKSFVSDGQGKLREAALILEGITCAACVWLNEKHLNTLPGIAKVQINYATHRAQISWDDSKIHLSDILAAIAQIGYQAHPYDPDKQQKLLERERQLQLKRLGLAGALGMQVMMIAVALYFGDWMGMEAKFHGFLQWVSLLLTIPVVLYSAQPFFISAWRDLRQWRAGMDVPVSLGILGAFGASVWNTLSGEGHVYYDSVVMFVFFLLTARFFELAGRRRSSEATERLVRMTPTVANRLVKQSDGVVEEAVAVAELQAGDRVRIRAGEVVPADGVILRGRSSIDESLLTGESLPVPRAPGEALVGGSVNVESPLEMRVEKVGRDTALSHIDRLLDRAQTEKPAITQLADRAASWFVLVVLVLAAGVALYWWNADPQHWLEITIAVLVVTCPCALSLATPTAITAGTGALTRNGLLATHGHTLETLARATHVVFDKTGTLTEGKIRLLDVHVFSELTRDQALQITAALERHSEHPIATALIEAGKHSSLVADAVENTPGGGIKGRVKGLEYALGNAPFVSAQYDLAIDKDRLAELHLSGNTVVFLAGHEGLHAAFELGDKIRGDARTLVQGLRADGLKLWLLSGDQSPVTHRIARSVGIDQKQAIGGLSPDQKLKHVQALQSQGAVVAMVGDGVNDAPVLAGAQVSIAMGSGAQVALVSADMIMLSKRFSTLTAAFTLGRKTQRIIRQNISWAVGYNLLALPAAAIGLVAPWLAAIGMSASSLLVVANALRLSRAKFPEN
ncbi:MAG: heavy metal translocating P-type ATPase [Gammaproteobacteria bacterium]|nr:heavy metal translocating P-type ATPase [Gammaproteobacteria bacterium]